ncbi:hypothetical protein Trydic_g16241 [Trypoxylus dichotomus]
MSGTLYPLLMGRGKLDPSLRIRIYKTVLRPIITYTSTAWVTTVTTHINKIQTFQSRTPSVGPLEPPFVGVSGVRTLDPLEICDQLEILRDIDRAGCCNPHHVLRLPLEVVRIPNHKCIFQFGVNMCKLLTWQRSKVSHRRVSSCNGLANEVQVDFVFYTPRINCAQVPLRKHTVPFEGDSMKNLQVICIRSRIGSLWNPSSNSI